MCFLFERRLANKLQSHIRQKWLWLLEGGGLPGRTFRVRANEFGQVGRWQRVSVRRRGGERRTADELRVGADVAVEIGGRERVLPERRLDRRRQLLHQAVDRRHRATPHNTPQHYSIQTQYPSVK